MAPTNRSAIGEASHSSAPSRVRKLLGVEPGQKVKVILYDNRIEMIPVRPAEEVRGFLKGIDTTVERESDRL